MKNLLFICLIAIGVNTTAQKIQFHANPGFVVSQIHGDKVGGYKKPGFSIGAGFLFKKSDTYEIDWSTRIIQKGAREPLIGHLARITYLETDIVFNYVYNDQLILGAGASYGYLMAVNDNGVGFGDAEYRRSDVAPLIKIGYRLNENIDITGRWANSILSIRKDANWYNNSLLFELSIKF